ncbi:MAG: SCP2 sterol-binding domain-containing protein [Actinomycetota bacterium]|nr:SCP2 sterol-binding domain-containing protein [Actinomycetota bacterium]
MATRPSRQTRRLDVNALARLARRIPEPVVRTGMSSPGGALVIDQIMRMVPTQLVGPQTVDAVVRWDVAGGRGGRRTWFLVFADGACKATRREPEERPRTTFTLTGEQLVRLATGRENPMAMFQAGRIGISGDLWFAAQLSSMFKIPVT